MLAVGSTFGDYVIEALAGSGGMGVVYRARQQRLDRPVALKLVAGERALEPVVRERLRREALLAASLDHPNVAPIYEAGEEDGTLYIASRWIEGADLGALIERDGPLGVERATWITAQVASALQEAHAKGLIHRDVKPSNVLVTAEDHAYLTDFGLTKRTETDSGLTNPGQLLGTIDYVAPEQLQGEALDARVDVYALGCLLFEALTGVVPFERESPAAKMWAHVNAELPSVRERRPEVSEQLEQVVLHALAKDPDERVGSAAEFREALLAAGLPSAPGAEGVVAGTSASRVTASPAAAEAPGERPESEATAATLAAPSSPPEPTSPPDASEPSEPQWRPAPPREAPRPERVRTPQPSERETSRAAAETSVLPVGGDDEHPAESLHGRPARSRWDGDLEGAPAPSGAPGRPARRGGRARRRVSGGLVLLLLLAVGGAGGYLALRDAGGAREPSPTREANQGSAQSGARRERALVPPPRDDPTAAQSATSARLRERGYDLIRGGQASKAVPVFRQAATVSSTEDGSYASAVFGLGRSLRLAGRPEDALRVLERRVELPPVTANSRRELAAARAAVASQ